MKKSLLAFAVLSTFAAAASAQTAVTLYGIADIGVAYTTKQNATGDNKISVDSGHLATSRWGIKGNEELSSDLSAHFALESGIKFDDGTSGKPDPLFDRKAYVGFASKSMGALDLGRQTNLQYDALGMVDPSNNAYSGTNPNNQFGALDNAGYYKTFGSTNGVIASSRQNNSIKYSSVDFGGISFGVQYAAGEVAGSTSAKSYAGISGMYKDSALTVIGVYSNGKDPAVSPALSSELQSFALGGRYAFDEFAIKATYAQNKVSKDNTPSADQTVKVFGIGADYSLSKELLLTAAYYNTKQDGATVATTGKADQLIGIAKYSLSKRTAVYGTVTYVKAAGDANPAVATLNRTLSLLIPSGAAGARAGRVAFGVVHSF